MTAYYNENDPYAAQWLRNLISAGHIAPGDVDERSIVDVRGSDLDGYTQCHFFAGIGGWSFALRLAGWGDDQAVWTGSCPCQPLSVSGHKRGHADERHLWPAFYSLIAECAPAIVFGEQVASKDGREWFAAVRADLEALGYACGGADLPAASVGAPHIRNRLWFVADTVRQSGQRGAGSLSGTQAPVSGARKSDGRLTNGLADGREAGDMAHTDGGDAKTERLQRGGEYGQQQKNSRVVSVGKSNGARSSARGKAAASNGHGRTPVAAGWDDCEWLPCTDGKSRPVEPGSFPLAHGIPGRVGRLRAYGNAIVPQVAAEFISAAAEAIWL